MCAWGWMHVCVCGDACVCVRAGGCMCVWMHAAYCFHVHLVKCVTQDFNRFTSVYSLKKKRSRNSFYFPKAGLKISVVTSKQEL